MYLATDICWVDLTKDEFLESNVLLPTIRPYPLADDCNPCGATYTRGEVPKSGPPFVGCIFQSIHIMIVIHL